MSDFKLLPPEPNFRQSLKRKGFNIERSNFEPVPKSSIIPESKPLLIYNVSKLTHNGIVGYRFFENCNRSYHRNSIANLLSSSLYGNETLDWLVSQYRNCKEDLERSAINNQAIALLDQESFDRFLTLTRQMRHLNEAQSRKVRSFTEKLCYYSATRVFTSKKTGKYKMKVAFLTLTAPESANFDQLQNAFTRFLEYLSRTANCVYVWKKELGETGKHLHFHLVINNFVPYYIISWKWKRALMAEGVIFPSAEDGKTSNSHYRIELPRSKKQVSHYISKYMSKAYDLPGVCGYIWGRSSILNQLKEVSIFEGDVEEAEVSLLMKAYKVIRKDYVSIICCDLLSIKDKFPKLAAIFEKQYLDFSNLITLPQRFNYVD